MSKKQRVYFVYEKLLQMLRREGYKNPGILASALLDFYFKFNGRIYAEIWVGLGLCQAGSFKEYRDYLVKFGWLDYNYDKKSDWAIHQPGARLMKYLNEEKFKKEEVLSRKDLDKALRDLAKNIIEDLNPPFTSEKLEKYLKSRDEG